MTLTTADLLLIVDVMTNLQMDQVESLTEGSVDDDDYSRPALAQIVRTLRSLERLHGDAIDVGGEIALAEALLEVDA